MAPSATDYSIYQMGQEIKIFTLFPLTRRRQVRDLHGGLGVVVMVDRFRLRLNARRAHRGYATQAVRPPVPKQSWLEVLDPTTHIVINHKLRSIYG